MPETVTLQGQIKPGDLYEDCAYHPCLCIVVNEEEVWEISLVDGTYPRTCDVDRCGIRRLTVEEVWQWRINGPSDAQLDEKHRW